VVTTSITISPPRDNIPDLTTVYTPLAYCVSRWMLPVSNGSYGTTVFSTRPKSSERGADSFYMGCQRFSTVWYSPGVCPDGQTVAEITEIRTSVATQGAGTFWRASCCMSGMTLGPEYSIGCISRFSTPLTAYYVVTNGTSTAQSKSQTLVETRLVTPGVIDDLTTATSVLTRGGIAIADPIVVGWEREDLTLFPTNYASSLAQRIGVPFTASSAVPASTSRLPQQTNSSSPSSASKSPHLTGGQIAGISIGVILAVALVGVGFFLLYTRKRRKATALGVNGSQLPEMEGQSSGIGRWFWPGQWRPKSKVQELNANVSDCELDGEGVRPELDSRAVVIVPGEPVELDAEEAQRK
jgi:hypothetical protein